MYDRRRQGGPVRLPGEEGDEPTRPRRGACRPRRAGRCTGRAPDHRDAGRSEAFGSRRAGRGGRPRAGV